MRYIYLVILLSGTLQAQLSSKETMGSAEKKSIELATQAIELFKKNDLKKSTELLFEAKEIAETTRNYELTAKIYGSIAHQYIQLKLNDKAKEYLQKAITEVNKLPENDTKITLKGLSYLDLGNIFFDEKKYEAANSNYKRSLKQFQLLSRPEPSVYHYRRSLYNIGRSFSFMKKNDSAEFYLNKALAVKDLKNRELKLYIYNALAQVYSDRGFTQRAVDSLKVALLDPQLQDAELKTEIYNNLAKNYRLQGNYKEYFAYNEKYINATESVKEKELSAINTAINAEQKDFRSVISRADQNYRRILSISAVLAIIFIGAIIYLILKRKREIKAFELMTSKLTALPSETTEKKIPSQPKDKTDYIPSPVETEILSRLEKFEASDKYINPKLNIANLAVQLATNTSYLSDVINKYKGKNFNTYINGLRIRYICDKIYNNPDYQKYKISYLAEECGFTSHSAFTTVFKNTTGISPSIFLREAAKKRTAN
ncbi:Transcriptional regulator [Flavobacteriaceae bacterium 3519-10]|nr:Transcriptional regulator [Flavobacteriaceae bacterium 3519-10]